MAAEAPEAAEKEEPAWFGCADLKYAEDGTVKILELGDGHTSGFTGAGAYIPHAFAKLGRPRRPMSALMDATLENKILTHGTLAELGLLHLRPSVGIFPRMYTKGLAASILSAVGGRPVVLKLADRQRGCGVVAVKPETLDETLKALLVHPDQPEPAPVPPQPQQLAECAQRAARLSGLKEQALHWCADECPNFLAESLCSSKLVQGGSGGLYDGTLRLGFALDASGLQLLGGYWKLPDVAADADTELSLRVVSHTRGGSGTAACAKEDEAAVWAVLEEPLWRFFNARPSVPALVQRHNGEPLLLANALARVAAGLIEEEAAKADRMLLLAEQTALEGGPAELRACVCSYIRRTQGTLTAKRRSNGGGPDWRAAAPRYDEALELMPCSAAAAYLAGMTRLGRGAYPRAAALFAQSLAADCDFACAYTQLATCCLMMGDPGACAAVAEAMLTRHARVAAGHYAIAVGLYSLEANAGGCDTARRTRAASALRRARELQRASSWGREEEEMLAALEGEEPLPKRPARTWLFHAWRL